MPQTYAKNLTCDRHKRFVQNTEKQRMEKLPSALKAHKLHGGIIYGLLVGDKCYGEKLNKDKTKSIGVGVPF